MARRSHCQSLTRPAGRRASKADSVVSVSQHDSATVDTHLLLLLSLLLLVCAPSHEYDNNYRCSQEEHHNPRTALHPKHCLPPPRPLGVAVPLVPLLLWPVLPSSKACTKARPSSISMRVIATIVQLVVVLSGVEGVREWEPVVNLLPLSTPSLLVI